MDDVEEAVQFFRRHAKPYDPAAPPGPRDIVLYEQADGPPRLFVGAVEYTCAVDPSADGDGFVLTPRLPE